MSACKRLDSQTLGSQPVMPKNLSDHCTGVTVLWYIYNKWKSIETYIYIILCAGQLYCAAWITVSQVIECEGEASRCLQAHKRIDGGGTTKFGKGDADECKMALFASLHGRSWWCHPGDSTMACKQACAMHEDRARCLLALQQEGGRWSNRRCRGYSHTCVYTSAALGCCFKVAGRSRQAALLDVINWCHVVRAATTNQDWFGRVWWGGEGDERDK